MDGGGANACELRQIGESVADRRASRSIGGCILLCVDPIHVHPPFGMVHFRVDAAYQPVTVKDRKYEVAPSPLRRWNVDFEPIFEAP